MSLVSCLVLLVLHAAGAQTDLESDHRGLDTMMEEVLVVGKQPGPPMWKVSKGDHELWIFGTLSPLPKGMIWESNKVEDVIAQSQEFLTPPGVRAGGGYNPFRLFGIVRTAISLSKNPDGETLEEVLSEDLYSRFSTLKARYVPRDKKIEKMRPSRAAQTLFNHAIAGEGLTNDVGVINTLSKLLKRNKGITTTDTMIEVISKKTELDKFTRDIEGVSLEKEITCFETTIKSIENDLEGMKSRANSWALGYADELRRHDYPDRGDDCGQIFADLESLGGLIQQSKDKWLTAAEQALANNQTTFAELPISNIIRPDGLLEQLRTRGYEIKEP